MSTEPRQRQSNTRLCKAYASHATRGRFSTNRNQEWQCDRNLRMENKLCCTRILGGFCFPHFNPVYQEPSVELCLVRQFFQETACQRNVLMPISVSLPVRRSGCCSRASNLLQFQSAPVLIIRDAPNKQERKSRLRNANLSGLVGLLLRIL